MYALIMTINHHYWKHDCKHYYARQEKEALESYSQKQKKASNSSHTTASQNKINLSLAVLFTKTFSFKPFLSSASKKQPNFPQVDFSSKLANNDKMISNECKKYLENNLCFYCGTEDYKLDFCFKKQTIVTPKSFSTSAIANSPASEKPLEKQRVTFRTLYRLRAILSFSVQLQVLSNSTYLFFLIYV